MLPDPLPPSPLPLLAGWLAEAIAAARQPNPNALVLATSSADGPSARVVLCKTLDAERGALHVFSNRESRKGRELAADPRAAGVFFWDEAGRQARVEGPVTRLDDAASDAYFATRPRLAQLGAWASRQSAPLAHRRDLDARVAEVAARFPGPVPRPPHWGGYVLWLAAVELWCAGDGRLHDRARWRRTLAPDPAGGLTGGPWQATRLDP